MSGPFIPSFLMAVQCRVTLGGLGCALLCSTTQVTSAPSGEKPAGTCESLWNLWKTSESSGLWVEKGRCCWWLLLLSFPWTAGPKPKPHWPVAGCETKTGHCRSLFPVSCWTLSGDLHHQCAEPKNVQYL